MAESGLFEIDDDDSGSMLHVDEFDLASTSTAATERGKRVPPHAAVASHPADMQQPHHAPHIIDRTHPTEQVTTNIAAAATPTSRRHDADDSAELTLDDDDTSAGEEEGEFHIGSGSETFSLAGGASSLTGPSHHPPIGAASMLLSTAATVHNDDGVGTSNPMIRLLQSINEVDRPRVGASATPPPVTRQADSLGPSTSHPRTPSAGSTPAALRATHFPEVVFRVLSMLRGLKIWQQVRFSDGRAPGGDEKPRLRALLEYILLQLKQSADRGHHNHTGLVPAVRLLRSYASTCPSVAHVLCSVEHLDLLLDIANVAGGRLIAASDGRCPSIWHECSMLVTMQLVWETIAMVTQQDSGAHAMASLLQNDERFVVLTNANGNAQSRDPFSFALNAACATGCMGWVESVLSVMHDVVLLGRWERHYLLLSSEAAPAIVALHQVCCRNALDGARTPSRSSSGPVMVVVGARRTAWKHLVIAVTATLEALASDVVSMTHNNNNQQQQQQKHVDKHDASCDVDRQMHALISQLYDAALDTTTLLCACIAKQRQSSKSGGAPALSASLGMLADSAVSIASVCFESFDGMGDSLAPFVVEKLMSQDAFVKWLALMDVLVHAHNEASPDVVIGGGTASVSDRSDAVLSRGVASSLFDKPLSSFYGGRLGAHLSSITSSLTRREGGGSPVDVFNVTTTANKETIGTMLIRFARLLKDIACRLRGTDQRRGTLFAYGALASESNSNVSATTVDPLIKLACSQFFSAAMSCRSYVAGALTSCMCMELRSAVLQLLFYFSSVAPVEDIVELLGPRTLMRSAALGATDDLPHPSPSDEVDVLDQLPVAFQCSRLLFRLVTVGGFSTSNSSEAAVASSLIKRITESYDIAAASSGRPFSNGNVGIQHEVKAALGALVSALARIAEASRQSWVDVVEAVDNYGGTLLATLSQCIASKAQTAASDSIIPIVMEIDNCTTAFISSGGGAQLSGEVATTSLSASGKSNREEMISMKYRGLTPGVLSGYALHASTPTLRLTFLSILMQWVDVEASVCDEEQLQNDLLALMLAGSPDVTVVGENPVTCLVYVIVHIPLMRGTLTPANTQRLLRTSISMMTTLGCDRRAMLAAARFISQVITSKQFFVKASMDASSLVAQILLLPVVNRNMDTATLAQVVLGMASLAVADKGVFDLVAQDSVNAERMFSAVLVACDASPLGFQPRVATPPPAASVSQSPIVDGEVDSIISASTPCGLQPNEIALIAEVWGQILKSRQERSDTAQHENERKILQEAAFSMEELRRKYATEVEDHQKTKKHLEQSMKSSSMSSPHDGSPLARNFFDQSSRSIIALPGGPVLQCAELLELGESQSRLVIEQKALVDEFVGLVLAERRLALSAARINSLPFRSQTEIQSSTSVVELEENCARWVVAASSLDDLVSIIHQMNNHQDEVARFAFLATAVTRDVMDQAVSPLRWNGSLMPSPSLDDAGASRVRLQVQAYELQEELMHARSMSADLEQDARFDLLQEHLRSLQCVVNTTHVVGRTDAQISESVPYIPSVCLELVEDRQRVHEACSSARHDIVRQFSEKLESLHQQQLGASLVAQTSHTTQWHATDAWVDAVQCIGEHLVEDARFWKKQWLETIGAAGIHLSSSSRKHQSDVRDILVRHQNELRERERHVRDESLEAFTAQQSSIVMLQAEVSTLKASYAQLEADSKEEIRCALEGSGLNQLYKKKEELLKSMHLAKLSDLQRSVDAAQTQAAAAHDKFTQSEQQHLKTIAALRLDIEELQRNAKNAESSSVLSENVHSTAVATIRDQAAKLQRQLSSEEALRKQLENKVSSMSKDHQRDLDAIASKHRAALEAAQTRFDQQLVKQLQDSRREAGERESQERVLLEQRARESNAKAAVLQTRVAELEGQLQSARKQFDDEVSTLRASVDKLQISLRTTSSKQSELEKQKSNLEKMYEDERTTSAMAREQVESLRMDFNLERLELQGEMQRMTAMLGEVRTISDRQASRLVEQEHKNDLLIKKLTLLELEDEVLHKSRGLEAYQAHFSTASRSKPGRSSLISPLKKNQDSAKGTGSLAHEAAAERDREQFHKDRQEAASLLAQYTEAQRRYHDADTVMRQHGRSKVGQLKTLAARPSSVTGLKALAASSKSQQPRFGAPATKVAWMDDAVSSNEAPDAAPVPAAEQLSLASGEPAGLAPAQTDDGPMDDEAPKHQHHGGVTWKDPFDPTSAADFQRQEYRADEDPHLHSFFRRMKR